MANYYGSTRTNYVKKTDELEKIFSSLIGCDDGFELIVDGNDTIGFMGDSLNGYCTNGCDKSKCPDDAWCDEDCKFFRNYDELCNDIQKAMPEDDALIITEVGSEKMRYLVGCSTVITKNETQFINIENASIEAAKKMLNNPDWDTKNNY